jgi:hypothetical protein
MKTNKGLQTPCFLTNKKNKKNMKKGVIEMKEIIIKKIENRENYFLAYVRQ